MNEIGIVQFSEGTYIGEIINGKADGYGRMTYANGDVYLGEWVSNCQTGQGAKSTANGYTVGTFVNGLKNGKCVAVENRGDTYNNRYYIGNYSNDVRSGHGTLITKNGSYIYYGNFSGGSPNGKGYLGENLGYSDGAFYGGNFVNGELNGSYYRYPRTSFEYVRGTFHGEVTDNLKHFFGYGALVSDKAYGTIQLGYHNKMNGRELAYNFKGVKVFKHNGTGLSIEEGDWGERVDTIPLDGNFCKIYKNGDVYIGGFVDDKRSGNGIYAKVGSRGIEDVSIRKNGKRYEISKSFSILVKGKFSGGELVDGEKYYDNGEVFVFETWGLTKQPTKNYRVEFRTYSGQLNDGSGVRSVGDGSSSVRELVEARLEREKQARQVTAPVVEEPIYAPVEHDYGDEYGENLTFAQKLKLQLQANRERRQAKKDKRQGAKKQTEESASVYTSQASTPQRQTNKTIAQQKKDYRLTENRTVLNGVNTKKEKHQLPNGIKSIMASAFLNDTTVKEIIGGNKIEFIGSSAFEGCENLEKVDLSKSNITEIKPATFKGCISLKTILLPTKVPVAVYHIDAFEGCPSELRINGKYTAQEYFDEFNVEAAKKKVWEEQERQAKQAEAEKQEKKLALIKEIGGKNSTEQSIKKYEEIYETVNNSDNWKKQIILQKVKKFFPIMHIPSYITYLDDQAFQGNNVVREVYFEKATHKIVVNPFAFKDCKNLEKVDFSTIEMSCIGEETFKNCVNLKEVFISEKMWGIYAGTIYEYAFENCTGLKRISLVKANTLRKGAFKGCVNLEEVYGKGLEEICEFAFDGCENLKKLTIFKKCKIKKKAFPKNLKIKKIRAGEQTILIFFDKNKPLSSAEKKKYIAEILARREPSKEEVPMGKVMDSDTSIERPKISVYEINEKSVFKHALIKVNEYSAKMEIPNNVESIEKEIFKGNNTIKEISFGTELRYLDSFALMDCTNLEKVDLSKTKIKFINKEVFKNCVNLKEVLLPENLECISEGAFENCKSLKRISLGKTDRIYEYSFKNCTSLEEVIAHNLADVKKDAFIGCENLKKAEVKLNCGKVDIFPADLKIKVTKNDSFKTYTFTKSN